MGCHTWFYKKVNRPIEEAREVYLKTKRRSFEAWKDAIANPYHRLREIYPEWDNAVYQKMAELTARQIRMVEKGLCNCAVMRKQPGVNRFINSSFYVSDDSLPHDLFRVGKYPEDLLFSLEETLAFIKKHKIEKVDMIGLFRFWKEFPDGMISFG